MAKERTYHKVLLPELYTWQYQESSTINVAIGII